MPTEKSETAGYLTCTTKRQVPYQPPHRSRIGLPNLGDTCYVNSAIQCLAHCTSLNPGLHALMPPDATMHGTGTIAASERIAAHYWEVIISGDLNVGHLNLGNLPNLLLEIRIVHAVDFQKQKQLDAHDAMIWLLQCIKYRTTSVEVDNFGVNMTESMTCQVKFCGRYDAPESDPVKFLSLSLEVPGYNTTLQACLVSFFAPQERQWRCDECNQLRPQSVITSPVGTYQIRCAGFPKFVNLHLKRFKSNANGSNTGGNRQRVDFPREKLAFGSVCNCTHSPKPEYNLMLVIQHMTTPGRTEGHFITIARQTVHQQW